jgi:hypothetical protein
VSRIIGRDALSLSCGELDSLAEGVRTEYRQSSRLVPNQATQLLRFSGLMNETQYFAPAACPCGKTTAKVRGLIRSYDYDGSPQDLLRPVVLETEMPAADISGYRLGLPDGCAIVER